MVFVAFERHIIHNMEQIKGLVKDLTTAHTLLTSKVDQLLRFSGATCSTGELPENVNFPMNSAEELDSFESMMEDDRLKQAVVI